jgi:histidine ammonia-lyase
MSIFRFRRKVRERLDSLDREIAMLRSHNGTLVSCHGCKALLRRSCAKVVKVRCRDEYFYCKKCAPPYDEINGAQFSRMVQVTKDGEVIP